MGTDEVDAGGGGDNGDEARLAEAVAELTERLRGGAQVDINAFALRDPQLASRLRAIFPTLLAMAELGPPRAGDATHALEPAAMPERLGDHRLVREIGRGGMGIVYEAWDVPLKRPVALKILPRASALDPRFLQRFQLEAQAAAGIRHPHIVSVYTVGTDQGIPYFTMPLIEGRSLAAVIADLRHVGESGDLPESTAVDPLSQSLVEGRFAPGSPPSPDATTPGGPSKTSPIRNRAFIRTATWLGQQAAEALDHAHRHGVVHRDIKPSNLLLDHQGVLWVADFGLARLHGDSDLTCSDEAIGTWRYMSPEQAVPRLGLVDHRTDIYSLGATLYELLTLRPACDGRDRGEILRQIVEGEPSRLRRLNPSVPSDLETIVHKAMAKEAGSRYDSAHELSEDLRRFLDGRPIRARRPTFVDRASKWSWRHRALVATSLGILVLSVVGLSVATALIAEQKSDAIVLRDEARKQRNEARKQSAEARRKAEETRRVSALAMLDRGQALCEAGDIGGGMLWMARAMETTPASEVDLDRALRRNLAAWRPYLSPVIGAFRTDFGPILSVTYSPDGKTVLVTSQAGGDDFGESKAWVCDSSSAEVLATFPPAGSPITKCRIASTFDGRSILYTVRDEKSFIWHFATGRSTELSHAYAYCLTQLVSYRHGHTILMFNAALCPDGHAVVTADRKDVERRRALPVSDSGSDLGETLRYFDTNTGQITGARIITHKSQEPMIVQRIGFNSDGTKVAVANSGLESSIQVFDTKSGARNGATIPIAQSVVMPNCVPAFSSDDRYLLAAISPTDAQVYTMQTGKPLGPPLTARALLLALTFSRDPWDNFHTFIGYDDGTIEIRDALSGVTKSPKTVLPGAFNAISMSMRADEERVVTGLADGSVRIHQLPRNSPTFVNLTSPTVRFSLGGDSLYTLEGTWVVRRDPVTANVLGKPIEISNLNVYGGQRIRVATNRTKSKLVLFTYNYYSLIDLDSDTTHNFAPVESPEDIADVVFSADSKSFLVVSSRGNVNIMNLDTKQLSHVLPESLGAVLSVQLSPDGSSLLAVDRERKIARLRDVHTGRAIGPEFPPQGGLTSATFSSDGKLVYVIDRGGMGSQFDPRTGQVVRRFLAARQPVMVSAVSPEQQLAFIKDTEETIRIYDCPTSRPIGPPLSDGRKSEPKFTAYQTLYELTPDPSGRVVLSTTPHAPARLWSVPQPVSGKPARLAAWVEVETGMHIDDDGIIRNLYPDTLRSRRLDLRQLGGPPES